MITLIAIYLLMAFITTALCLRVLKYDEFIAGFAGVIWPITWFVHLVVGSIFLLIFVAKGGNMPSNER
jgi:hypothetical protein